MKLLAGDIGGTKTLLRLSETGPDRHMATLHEARYPSAEHADLAPIVRDFLARAPDGPHSVAAACFALAGPVQDSGGSQRARLTNLPWQLDSHQLERALEIPRIRLINDFAGVGYSIGALPPAALTTLQAGQPDPTAPSLVLGAGTGLGVCTLCPVPGGAPRLLAAEAGHANFSPADEQQSRLAGFVREREGHCTREHLLSGIGLQRIYEFVCQEAGLEPAAIRGAADPPAAISQLGLTGDDPLAAEALGLFVRIYAGQAADLALAVLPFAGVYLAGGIAPKILARLREPDVITAFTDRPPMRALLEAMPLRVVLDQAAGLTGALECARRLADTLEQV